MPMDVIVRRALDEELEAVGELTAHAYLVDGLVRSDYVNQLKDARRRAAATELLVAVDGDLEGPAALLGAVAFVVAGTPYAEICHEGEAEFRMLAVAPEARRRGVGRLLARACIDRARASGASQVVICSSTAMPAAHRLYERLGFQRLPDRDWSPGEGTQLIAFRLPLDAGSVPAA